MLSSGKKSSSIQWFKWNQFLLLFLDEKIFHKISYFVCVNVNITIQSQHIAVLKADSEKNSRFCDVRFDCCNAKSTMSPQIYETAHKLITYK